MNRIDIDGIIYLDIQNHDKSSKLRICPNEGGRIAHFIYNGLDVFPETSFTVYKNRYAAAILFPFTNRIRDGKYTFKEKDYQLNCNELDKNNALHGLVYDKSFKLIDVKVTSEFASVSLKYKNDKQDKAFPFFYEIELVYTLNHTGLNLKMNVINLGDSPFPFTIGWHPYFSSSNLDKSTIRFDSSIKYLTDDRNIIVGKLPFNKEKPIELKNLEIDDGFMLKTNIVEFTTPDYKAKIISSGEKNFLQIYIPPSREVIAIEPMTGACNSFNNDIGLQTLLPNNNYEIEWSMIIV
ncbi:aldose 1-epimerase [uncultured Aquimarina sp.]|uniref:aldose 1-epimerase n=1 Tax=uncultured Aquimarina sp. TaxID=575652 RepID=UPI00261386A3|nr:aldose 1-epimerase [uncultured Aquimarina sp.]